MNIPTTTLAGGPADGAQSVENAPGVTAPSPDEHEQRPGPPPPRWTSPASNRRARARHSSGTPWAAVLNHLVVSVFAILLALGLGLGAAVLSPVSYTAESRIAVGGNDLSAQALAGYALGSQQLAASYSRYINNSAAQAGADPAAGTSVSASPIPESNIIRIESIAATSAAAVRACQQAADALVAQVNALQAENDPAKVMAQVVEKTTVVTQQQQAVDDAGATLAKAQTPGAAQDQAKAGLQQAREALAKATVERDALSDRYRALVAESKLGINLLVVRPAAVVKNDRSSAVQRYGFLGLVAGVVGAVLVSMALDRRWRRKSRAIVQRRRRPGSLVSSGQAPGSQDISREGA